MPNAQVFFTSILLVLLIMLLTRLRMFDESISLKSLIEYSISRLSRCDIKLGPRYCNGNISSRQQIIYGSKVTVFAQLVTQSLTETILDIRSISEGSTAQLSLAFN